MKIAEFRAFLAEKDKDEIIKIAAELYKKIPKDIKLKFNIDSFVTDVSKKKNLQLKEKEIPLSELSVHIESFISDARNSEYQLYNSRSYIHKSERKKWRFILSKFVTALSNPNKYENEISEKIDLLKLLYLFMWEAENLTYFYADSVWSSSKIDSNQFLITIKNYSIQKFGKKETCSILFELITNPHMKYAYYTEIIDILINTADNPDLKEFLLEKVIVKFENYEKYIPKKISSDINSKLRDNYNFVVFLLFKLYHYLKGKDFALSFLESKFSSSKLKFKYEDILNRLYDFKMKDEILIIIESAKKKKVRLNEFYYELAEKIIKNSALT